MASDGLYYTNTVFRIHVKFITDDASRLSNGLLSVVNYHCGVSRWTSVGRNIMPTSLCDANLCADSWQSDDYDRKSVAQPLLDCLQRNGLQIHNTGATFQADHLLPNGSVSTSALDHVYSTEAIKDCVSSQKLKNSSSDHLPVMVSYNLDKNKVQFTHSVTKRSFKNFTKEAWNDSLAKQDWMDVEDFANVDLMVKDFNEKIKLALDVVAPIKTFKIRSNHRFGLSEDTKAQMKKRDQTREAINKASPQETLSFIHSFIHSMMMVK